jgi:hypothetical protein
MAYKVFISSSIGDIDLAKDLAERIKTVGIHVYPVERSTASGESMEAGIKRALREADEVVVILTDRSTKSPGVFMDLGAAFSLNKRITPIAIGIEDKDLPPLLKRMKYIKWTQLPRYLHDLEERTSAGEK